MEKFKKYGVLSGILITVFAVVQIICSCFEVPVDVNIFIEIASILLTILVLIGVVKKEDSTSQDFNEIKQEIKDDLNNKLEKNDQTINNDDENKS